MIVRCDKCRTKFRIADERVSAKGVKVRCSRCAHVFVVHRAEEHPKFTEDGPDTRRLDPSELMSLAAQTDPGMPDPPDAPTIPNPAQDAATTEQVAVALGFAGEHNPGQDAITLQSALPASQPPFSSPPPSQAPLPVPSQVPQSAPSQVPQSAPSQAPLSVSSQADPELPSFPSWSTSATVAPEPSDHPAPPPLPTVDDGFDFPPPAYAPDDAEASQEMDGEGFAFGASPFGAAPEDTSNGFPPPLPAPSSDGFVPASAPASSNPFELPAVDSSLAPPLPSPPSPASSPFAAPLNGLGNSSDIPGLIPPDAVGDTDPFADDSFTDAPQDDDEGWAPPADSDSDSLIPAPVPVARIHLGAAGMPNVDDRWSQGETTAIAAAYVPESLTPTPQELPVVGDRSGLWPSLVGALLGVAVVLMFLPEVGQGILDTFTRRGADALVRVSQSRVLSESLPNLRALDTHVSVYRIASGEKVLVVRGVARNLGKTPARGLSAVALAMNGDTVVARATAAVGVLLSPDVLATLETPAEVSGAYAQRAAAGFQAEVQPGAEQPFMVVFPEMPKDPEDRIFLVEFLSFAP